MGDGIKAIFKNYSIITKCDFMDDDEFSYKLVEYYKRYAYSCGDSEDCKNRGKAFDYLMRKYIEDFNFSKRFKKSIDVKSFLSTEFSELDALIEYMERVSLNYDNDKQEIVVNTKWI